MAARRSSLLVCLLGALVGTVAPLVAPPAAATAAGSVRNIEFPVEGKVWYSDDYGAPRVGHTHQGNDIFGKKLQTVVATRNGYISWWNTDADGSAGNYLVLRDNEGWTYWYMHLNNDTPGTDDGKNPSKWRFYPGISLGRYVVRGEPIAFLGDSGNAEGTSPHVHFEVHDPAGNHVNPFPSLQGATHVGRPTAVALAGRPGGGHYVLTSDGRVRKYGGVPGYGQPVLESGATAVDLELAPDGKGYAVLDSTGRVHSFGSVKGLPQLDPGYLGAAPARALTLTADGDGYLVLDGWGRVHNASALLLPDPLNVHQGDDTARDIDLMPDQGGYAILERDGSLTLAGSAVSLAALDAMSFPSGNARRLVVSPTGAGLVALGKSGKLKARGDLAGASSPIELTNAVFVGLDEVDGTVGVIKKSGLHTRWASAEFASAHDSAP